MERRKVMEVAKGKIMKHVKSFTGSHSFLSNFYPASVHMDGFMFSTAEHAYQSCKTTNKEERAAFASKRMSPASAKHMGNSVRLRKGWEKIKDKEMLRVVLLKFMSNNVLMKKILATGDAHLEEGNNWGDDYWGTVHGRGKNRLGEILEGARDIMKILTREEENQSEEEEHE